jgi:ABC-2 type transport system permease protein
MTMHSENEPQRKGVDADLESRATGRGPRATIPFRRIFAQARKELTQMSRDKLTLALALALPLIQMWLLGEAVSLTVTDLPVVIQDLDRTPSSRRYVEAILASITFRVVPLADGTSPEEALDRSEARAAIVIPEHFERDLVRRSAPGPEIQWLLDGTDANTANLMRGNAAAITSAFNAKEGIGPRNPAIRVNTRIWFNPGRDSDQYIGPAVFAIGLALFPPLLAVLAMARETEQRTILQVYVSSISAFEYLAGKVVAYLVVAIAEWALTLGLAIWLYDLSLVSSATPFLLTSALYLFCTVSFGVMLGARVPDQASAIQAVQNVGFLLSYLMSGFVYPLSNIPEGLRWISTFVSARFFIEASRDAFVRGGGWMAMWHAPVMLALLGGLFFFSAWAKMRRMQEDV